MDPDDYAAYLDSLPADDIAADPRYDQWCAEMAVLPVLAAELSTFADTIPF